MLMQTVEELSAVQTKDEEMFVKASSSVEMSMKIVNSLNRALVAVDAGQNNTANAIEILEENLDRQIQLNKELKRDLSRLNDDLNGEMKNLKQMVTEAVKEELEKIKQQSKVLNTNRDGYGGGAAASYLGRAVGPVGGKLAQMTPTMNRSTVRGFSLANEKDMQKQAMVDSSSSISITKEKSTIACSCMSF